VACAAMRSGAIRPGMKPPHNNRPGGSRPPSSHGPRPHGPGGGGGASQRGENRFNDPTPRHGGPGPQQQQRHGGQSRHYAGPPRHQDGQRPHDGPRHAPEAPKGTVWLYGHHAVAAALANPARRLRRLLLTEEAEAAMTQHLAPPWALAPERVERARLDQLLGRDVVHQGAALLADPLAPPSLQSVLDKRGAIVVLDQVTDPRNVGAIMRSAAAFGAAAVITQDRNAPEETGALAKTASGALETMPLLRAVNIARTIIALKAANIWCIGLDAAGKPLSGPAFAERRVAIVLGAEGEGLRRLTRETCDEIAGLSIKGAMDSLNVSAAAAVALYELSRR
jgi:23S rRNA (guanosine2251-2'-O)-methyltransferase